MNEIFVCGLGAVSPAGWGVEKLRDALAKNVPIPTQTLNRPGWIKPLLIRNVPPPETRPEFFMHPRLRRAGSITEHAVGAALEALGTDVALIQSGALRLGVIVSTMAGGIAYSRKFYEEVMRGPATASPAIFPETVFNAPASHLAAYLNTSATSYTLVGDDGTFLQALALAAGWLVDDRVDGVVVVGVEEMDWIVAEAMRLFQHTAVHSAGAGALYLRKNKASGVRAELKTITDPFLFTQNQNRAQAAQKMRTQLPPGEPGELLCVSAQSLESARAENLAWRDWPGRRLESKSIVGEAFTASVAWQCVAACDAIMHGRHSAANISVLGANQQAIGARFLTCRNVV